MTTTTWTRDLILRRRHLHAAIDAAAERTPNEAARLRLDLYTITHDFDVHAVDESELATGFDLIELDLTRAAA
ncbi:hypothetical protein DVJ78_13725 [Humibacter sp. BT305]|uniref:Uncharacterized protein n=1 Tax=Cnuibacter physcomitrellae TaxID=1619308 RepID=A0A1X9LPG3_9MICO|nr:hypothetical protein [Cnuibacter physcomitrellae]ARJ05009.1 hypothetical protein B5808_07165 [Cnuibacter physcomitrellae]AXH36340.1 hypothetical protein DVJ78_13725 [Humibacter sp. BT305]MCS5498838.1 hypothetical protein [Cnuibacter physcomitrellae]GGI34733.1 hypothetical protein GCM10010988_00400 [Cnuibacter physcomitrellae]